MKRAQNSGTACTSPPHKKQPEPTHTARANAVNRNLLTPVKQCYGKENDNESSQRRCLFR